MGAAAASIFAGQGTVVAAGGLLVLCMGLWATGLVAEIVTALMFFALAMLLKLAPAQTVFSGFASSAFWLVTSGMVVGLAMNRTWLGDRLARMLAARLPASYPGFIAGLVAFSFALAFVMPSNLGRIALMVPVVIALCDAFGLEPERPGLTGALLAFGIATPMLSAAILPANVPNLVMAGTAETLFGIHLNYLPYLFLHAPVLGLVKGALLVACTMLIFPDRLDGTRPDLAPLPPPSGAERRLSVILAVMLALWLSDGWHGIPPAWIGLAAAVICLLPGIGVLSSASFAEIPLRTCFYVAALFGLTAVVNETGLGADLGHALLTVAPLEPGCARQELRDPDRPVDRLPVHHHRQRRARSLHGAGGRVRAGERLRPDERPDGPGGRLLDAVPALPSAPHHHDDGSRPPVAGRRHPAHPRHGRRIAPCRDPSCLSLVSADRAARVRKAHETDPRDRQLDQCCAAASALPAGGGRPNPSLEFIQSSTRGS